VYPHRFQHHFSHTWLDRGGTEGDLMEPNGCSCTFRSILEPEAPPEAIKNPWAAAGCGLMSPASAAM
jgi:hypothetical protein